MIVSPGKFGIAIFTIVFAANLAGWCFVGGESGDRSGMAVVALVTAWLGLTLMRNSVDPVRR